MGIRIGLFFANKKRYSKFMDWGGFCHCYQNGNDQGILSRKKSYFGNLRFDEDTCSQGKAIVQLIF